MACLAAAEGREKYMGTEHNTMSSAPVYSRNLNGMMVGACSNADLRKMVQADKPQAVAVPATMAFDVQPQRGDMLRIQHWLEQGVCREA